MQKNIFSVTDVTQFSLKGRMKNGDEAMLLVFYVDAYTSNGVGANAPKKGIALIPFVKNNVYPNLKEHRSDTI